MSTTVRDLLEFKPAGLLRDGKIDRDAGIIRDTMLITPESRNGEQGRRIYTAAALAQVVRLAEGLPAYANHVAKELAFKPRDVREMIGRHRNVRRDAQGNVRSDLHVLEHHRPWVFALADDLGDVVGNSLVSRGSVRLRDGVEIVEEVVAVRSVDLVSDPGATRGLFEHLEEWRGHHPMAMASAAERHARLAGLSESAEAAAARHRRLGRVLGEVLVEDQARPADVHARLTMALTGQRIVPGSDERHRVLAEAMGDGEQLLASAARHERLARALG